MTCYNCDMVIANNLGRFLDDKSQITITDCIKCGGIKSKVMFTLDYVGDGTHG